MDYSADNPMINIIRPKPPAGSGGKKKKEPKPPVEKLPPQRQTTNCLLLKTPDNRLFFTHETNLPMLVEFGRTFGAEISRVHAENVFVLELEDLAKSICEPKQDELPKYEVLEVKISPTDKRPPTPVIDQKAINQYVKEQLLANKLVTIEDLATKYPDCSRQKLGAHIMRTVRELTAEGHTIVKIKPGEYQRKERVTLSRILKNIATRK